MFYQPNLRMQIRSNIEQKLVLKYLKKTIIDALTKAVVSEITSIFKLGVPKDLKTYSKEI